jgi:hypothetical protein
MTVELTQQNKNFLLDILKKKHYFITVQIIPDFIILNQVVTSFVINKISDSLIQRFTNKAH